MFWIIGAGAAVLFIIFAAVTTYWEAIAALPDSVAAFLGALSGAGGGLLAIIIGALFNAELNRQRDNRLRREEGRSLALALRGEMLSVADSYERHKMILTDSIDDSTSYAGPPGQIVRVKLRCSVAIFSKSSDRLGLLEDPDLIANLAQFYSSLPTEDESESFDPALVLDLCRGRIEIADRAIARATYLAQQLHAVAKRMASPP